MRKLMGVFLLTVVAIMGCSSSSDPDDDDDGGENPTIISGTIDGAPWTGTINLASRSGSQTVTVSVNGRDAQDREVIITISPATGAGTYAIGNGQPAAVRYQVGSAAWVGHLAGASGNVILSALTTTSMSGTFNVTLVPQTSSATGNKILIGSFIAFFGQT